MTTENQLLIFVRNPELGKVKTRLAKTTGDQKALAVYKLLLEHTQKITQPVSAVKKVWYSDYINRQDIWPNTKFQKQLQPEGDLGCKMEAAFKQAFAGGFSKVMIIGSDCFELTTELLEQAFLALDSHDVVAGPAADGGYYLLGMKQLHLSFFRNKTWSTDLVLQQTLYDAAEQNLNVKLLPVLNDIDTEADLMASGIDIETIAVAEKA
ncbi:MAG: TIGR04282 family arsenosugar biosynthesis glycosyltransferase [Hymenobacteraceae bacterium]|nr:TIGR04282 family arsenosugar biosynthesis glycosyltransferase [Hymenobacteraceae bacterium]